MKGRRKTYYNRPVYPKKTTIQFGHDHKQHNCKTNNEKNNNNNNNNNNNEKNERYFNL